ncbi:MAG: hypothetical protein K6G17_06155 [Oscillospiraceae bacterium]|nr:hypothetical protein [Oscillospiraceae bacterium]
MKRTRLFCLLVSLAGLLTLAVGAVLWWRGSHYTALGRAAALVSIALFALLGLRFVPQWAAFWGEEAPAAPDPGGEPPRMALKIALALLGFDAAVLWLAWVLRVAMGHYGGFAETLSFWRCTDSQHYLAIADDWYLSEGSRDRLVQLVFLPGYPLAIRLFRLVTGDTLTAGLLCSGCCFAGAGVLFYRLLRLDLSHEAALRALTLLCLIPGSFFFAAPMSESLFLLCCLACLYLARKGRWLFAALCGAAAAFTRSLGLLVLAPLILELVAARLRGKLSARGALAAALSLPLVLCGFGAYCFINYRVSGDPFRFLVYQSEHWNQRLSWFFNTAAYQTELLAQSFGKDKVMALGLWLPNVLACFGALAVTAAAAPRLRASYGAWFIATYAVAVGATWLLSAPRYLAAMPVLPLALALLADKPRRQTAAYAVLAALSALYFLAFLLRWQVW